MFIDTNQSDDDYNYDDEDLTVAVVHQLFHILMLRVILISMFYSYSMFLFHYSVAKDYVRLMKYGDTLYRCKQLKKAALGRYT